MTTEPQESVWLFPPASSADENGLVAVGADITPSTLLAAYRNGLFPMPLEALSYTHLTLPTKRIV